MFKAIIHIILVFSIFISSGGVWINSYFCQNELIKTTLFFKSKSCCEKDASASCHKNKRSCSEDEHDDEGCCDSQKTFYKLDHDQQIGKVGIEIPYSSSFLILVVFYFNQALHSFENRNLKFFFYIPPDIKSDHQVTLQTFLL